MLETVERTDTIVDAEREITGTGAAAMRLRKAVFADQPGWDVPVHGDMEQDAYDSLGATCLIWSGAAQRTVHGKKPVYLGSFAVTDGVLATMCAAIAAAAGRTALRCGLATATMRERAVA